MSRRDERWSWSWAVAVWGVGILLILAVGFGVEYFRARIWAWSIGHELQVAPKEPK